MFRSSPGPSSGSTPGSPASPRVPPDKDVLKLMTRVLRKMEEVAKTHSERLRFLDPELESTNTRIEVLEALCKANENKINGLTKARTCDTEISKESLILCEKCYR